METLSRDSHTEIAKHLEGDFWSLCSLAGTSRACRELARGVWLDWARKLQIEGVAEKTSTKALMKRVRAVFCKCSLPTAYWFPKSGVRFFASKIIDIVPRIPRAVEITVRVTRDNQLTYWHAGRKLAPQQASVLQSHFEPASKSLDLHRSSIRLRKATSFALGLGILAVALGVGGFTCWLGVSGVANLDFAIEFASVGLPFSAMFTFAGIHIAYISFLKEDPFSSQSFQFAD